jgi:hypothetical protein
MHSLQQSCNINCKWSAQGNNWLQNTKISEERYRSNKLLPVEWRNPVLQVYFHGFADSSLVLAAELVHISELNQGWKNSTVHILIFLVMKKQQHARPSTTKPWPGVWLARRVKDDTSAMERCDMDSSSWKPPPTSGAPTRMPPAS